MRYPTAEFIFNRNLPVYIRESTPFAIPLLFGHYRKIDAAAIQSCTGACFHSANFESQLFKLLTQPTGGSVTRPPSNTISESYMHKSVQKSAVCQYYRVCGKTIPKRCNNPFYLILLNNQFLSVLLPDMKIIRILQNPSPFPCEELSVTLCPGAPHCRPL